MGADDKERAELPLTFNNHHDEHESHHHQTNTPHERNQSGDRARGVVQRSRDTTDQGRRGRHGHPRHARSNVGGNRINVSARLNPDHDRGDNVVRVKTRVLVETFLQRRVDENSRSIKVGVHSVVEGRTSLIELGDDTQPMTEERKVLRIGHPDIRTDDHLHVTETGGARGVRNPRLNGEVRGRVERDDLIAARTAAGPRSRKKKLRRCRADTINARNLTGHALIHIEVGRFGAHQERLRIKVGRSISGSHHDVGAEARLDRTQSPVNAAHNQGATKHHHRHEHREKREDTRAHRVPAQVHPRESRKRQHVDSSCPDA